MYFSGELKVLFSTFHLIFESGRYSWDTGKIQLCFNNDKISDRFFQNSSTHQKCQNILHGNMNMKASHNIQGYYIFIVRPKYLW